METFKNVLKIIGATVGFFAALVLITMLLVGAFSPIMIADCNAKTQDIGEGRWLYFGGCQVKIDGRWIPLDNYRYFEEE